MSEDHCFNSYFKNILGEFLAQNEQNCAIFALSLDRSVQSWFSGATLAHQSGDSNSYAAATSVVRYSKLETASTKIATQMPPPPPQRRSSSKDDFRQAQSLPPKKDTLSNEYDENTASLTGSSSSLSNEHVIGATDRTGDSSLAQVDKEPSQERREKRGTIHVNRMRWVDPKNGLLGAYTGKVNDHFVPHGYGAMEYDPHPKNDMSGLGMSVNLVKDGKWKDRRFRRLRSGLLDPS